MPVRTISDSGLPEGTTFSALSDARLLPDGRLLVANGAASEILAFDPSGAIVKRVGRKGQGPGDFIGPLHLFSGPADSIVVADGRNLRWSIWDSQLGGNRTSLMAQAPFPRPSWLHRGALIVEATLGEVPAWVGEVIDSLRARDPNYTHRLDARRDDLGVLWVRDSVTGDSWSGYAGARAPVAAVSFPPGFRVTQIGADFVVGVARDSLEVERVEVLSLARQPAAVDHGPSLAQLPASGDSAMYRQLMSLMVAQEQFYADHASYTARVDSLAIKASPDLRVFGIAGDRRQWSALVVDRATGATCGVWIGRLAPPGWLDGTPVCAR